MDPNNGSQVVSPEQSEDGAFPPVAEAGTMNYNPQQRQHVQLQHSGMNAPVAPGPGPYATPALLAPAPSSNARSYAQNMVVHNYSSVAKRQRVENGATAPGMAMPVPNSAPTSSFGQNGQQMMNVSAAPEPVTAAEGGRGRKKSQAQIDRRRERNRILARRTRLRKKFFFESLQKEVMDLQQQNIQLKDLVKSRFGTDESRKVLDTCNAVEKLPESVVEACGEHAAEMDQQDFNLVRSVQQSQHSFVITDPCLQDNPIVFASDGFLKITGYARESVLGRNCRFLQGPETSKEKTALIRRSLQMAEDVTVTMVNYMADGTPFWNKLFIAALRDSSNNIVNFIGVVVKVASPPVDDPEFGTNIEQVPKMTMTADNNQANASAADGTVGAMEGPMSVV